MGHQVSLTAAILATLYGMAVAGPHNPPHPMDRFLYESFITAINPAVSLTLNSTVQTFSSQKFLLTIAGTLLKQLPSPGLLGRCVCDFIAILYTAVFLC